MARFLPELLCKTIMPPQRISTAHLGDPPNIFPSIFLAKPQILVQAEAHIVSIEAIGGEAKVEQMLFKSNGDSGFTAGREAGEPEGEALLAAQGGALVVGEAVVPCYISEGEEGKSTVVGRDMGRRGTPT